MNIEERIREKIEYYENLNDECASELSTHNLLEIERVYTFDYMKRNYEKIELLQEILDTSDY